MQQLVMARQPGERIDFEMHQGFQQCRCGMLGSADNRPAR